MKKYSLILLLFFAASYAFGQTPAKNAAVRATVPTSGIIGDAIDGSLSYTASGTDTYTITTDAAYRPYAGSLTYAAGDLWTVTFTNANTSGTITLNVDTEGAVAVKDNEGNDLAIGAIPAGGTFTLRHNGTHLRVVGASGGGGGAGLVDGDYGDVTVGGTGTTMTVDNAAITYAKFQNLAGLSIFGRSANSSGVAADITAGTDGYVLRRSGTSIGFGTIGSASVDNTIRAAVNSVTALVDASSIDLTAIKHSLASSSSTRTFTISYTGDDITIEVTLSTTMATYTFPSGSLCVSDGFASGDNTMILNGVSGDKYIIAIKKMGSAYYVVSKNFGQ